MCVGKKMRVQIKRKKEYQDILFLLDEVHKNCEKPEKNKKAEQMEKRINTMRAEDLLRQMTI